MIIITARNNIHFKCYSKYTAWKILSFTKKFRYLVIQERSSYINIWYHFETCRCVCDLAFPLGYMWSSVAEWNVHNRIFSVTQKYYLQFKCDSMNIYHQFILIRDCTGTDNGKKENKSHFHNVRIWYHGFYQNGVDLFFQDSLLPQNDIDTRRPHIPRIYFQQSMLQSACQKNPMAFII